ncbi:MAG: outer membrane protein [Trichloromonadaceae bacterium]
MKPTLILCALALFGLLTTIPAQAEDYIGGNISYTAPQDADFEYKSVPFELKSSYDNGIGFGLVFGKSYNNNLRIEGELGYRNNDLDAFVDNDTGEILGAAGDITALSFLFNTYYDIANPSRFTPYLGAGLGGAYVSLDARTVDPEFGDIVFSDEALAFAYQLGTGVACKLNRLLTLDLGYRYFSTAKLKFKDQDPSGDNSFETDYSAHNIALGLRLAF